MHFGALYGGNSFDVTGSLPGVLVVLGRYGFPRLLVVSLLLPAWLAPWRGGVTLQEGIARRTATR